MSDEIRKDDANNFVKYAPKRLRDQAPSLSPGRPGERPHVLSGPTVPPPGSEYQARRIPSDFSSPSEPASRPRLPDWLDTGTSTSSGRSRPARPSPPALPQPRENDASRW